MVFLIYLFIYIYGTVYHLKFWHIVFSSVYFKIVQYHLLNLNVLVSKALTSIVAKKKSAQSQYMFFFII